MPTGMSPGWTSQNNNLNGTLPATLADLAYVERLSLYKNQLSGSIPTELGQLANLRILWLGANSLSGTLPAQLGGLSNLETADTLQTTR